MSCVFCCAGILKSRTTPEQERAYNSILDRRETEGEASKHQAVHPPHMYLVSTVYLGGFTIIYSKSDLSNNFRYGFSPEANPEKNMVQGTLCQS
jgi:hypothetical protein